MQATNFAPPVLARGTRFGGLNPSNVAAGVLVIVLYAASPLPFYLALLPEFGEGREIAFGGVVVTFVSAGVFTIGLSLLTKQPLAVGFAMPVLFYLSAASQEHSMAELAGASLVAGVAMLVIALTGLAERVSNVIPLPVVMAVLAGSSLDYLARAAMALETHPLVAGAPIAGYFIARGAGWKWLPPLGGALLLGLPVAFLGTDAPPIETGLPPIEPVAPAFDIAAIAALSPILLAVALVTNIQGFSMLEVAGYRPRRTLITLVSAVMTMAHAFFVAPPGCMQRAGLAAVAGEDAGPRDQRYIAAIIGSVGAIALGLGAVSLAGVVAALPAGFTATMTGIVLLSIVMDALHRSFSTPSSNGAMLALAITLSGVSLLGLGATVWALVAGTAAWRWMDRKAAG